MSDDPIALLERELLDAARRRARAADGDDVGRRRTLRRRVPGALAVAASVLLVVVIAGGALLALRSGGRSGRQSAAALVAPWADRLATLRRPQDRLDQLELYREGDILPTGVVDPGSVRFARRTPWGAPVLLGVQVRGGHRGQLVLSMPTWSSTVQLSPGIRGLSTGHGTVAVVGPKRGRGAAVTRIVLIAGDGIARVSVRLAGGPARSGPVVGNVGAVELPQRCCSVHFADRISVTGYGPTGRVVRRWRPTVETVVDPDGTTEN